MKFRRFTTVPGAYVIEPEPIKDPRGLFARTFCRDEFRVHGLIDQFVQCSISFSDRRGTLRGMHFQRAPSLEGKLIRCTQGAAIDVVLDLRPDSPAYCRWEAVEISAENRLAVYMPPGIAHGVQTLADGTELLYQMADLYAPQLAGGVRWNDPAFRITWPILPPILSEKDASYPDFAPEAPRR